MVEPEQPIDRFPIPGKPARQLGAGNLGGAERPIKFQLERGERRQRDKRLAALEARCPPRARHFAALGDFAGDQFLKRADRVRKCAGAVLPVGDQPRQFG